MRLYKGQIDPVSGDLLEAMTEENDLEVTPENMPEVKKDIQSVLREYIRLDRELVEQAKDDISRGARGSIGKKKAELAESKGLTIVDDPVGYIVNQLIETFFHSNFVDEVYSLDREMRAKMAPILKDYMSVEEELDDEVRDKIKNLEEGSQAWDIEYQKVMGNLKRDKDLE